MERSKRNLGYLEGILSAILNSILFGFKLWAGMRAGSVAMMADAWHTLSDTLTSLVVILGFWLASKPGDKEHPFGHGRAELVAALIIGTMLGLVGVNFFKDSILQLRAHHSAIFGGAAILVFSVSIVLKEGIAQFSIRAGKKVNSQALIADGWHHRSDAIASALILVGALLGRYFWWIDGALGVGVAVLIIHAAYDIIKGAANPLIGEGPDEELKRKISAIVKDCAPEISDVHHLHFHRYGDHVEVTLHIRVPEDMSLKRAHGLATLAEDRIREKLSLEATIHLEPNTTDSSGSPEE